MSQGIYWLLTIPHANFTPYLPTDVAYVRGQLERGDDTGYLHWQLLVVYARKCRLAAVKKTFGSGIHAELSRSNAADAYVWKDDTRVDGTQFELGQRKLKRNDPTDWALVRRSAVGGRLDDIPDDIYVRCYNQLRRIESDHLEPIGIERRVQVYWGSTGTGKSRRAWNEAGMDAYPKDPRSKFWDGYRGQAHVVIDEFRGGIDISHILRWLDRYPVIVEVKGASTVFSATDVWITSNLDPRLWYPELDAETVGALLRRMNIVHFENPFE